MQQITNGTTLKRLLAPVSASLNEAAARKLMIDILGNDTSQAFDMEVR
jgi:hypothetical protein